MAAAAILKSALLAITHRRIVRFQWNFVWGSRMAGQQGLRDNNCKFFKIQRQRQRPPFWKSLNCHISSEKSSDFDQIWYTASDIEPGYSHVTKNCNVWNSRWRRRPPSWKSLFWPLLINRLSDFSEILYEKQNGMLTRATGQKMQMCKIQDGGRPLFWKSLNRHISVTNCLILIKFGTLHKIFNPVTVTWWNFWNSSWRRPPSWNSLFWS